jgi:hypothetical protein
VNIFVIPAIPVMPITISLKSLSGDIVGVDLDAESGSTCVRALREKAAHLFGLAKCPHTRPPDYEMDLDESEKWKIVGSCPTCTLHPSNIALIRPVETGWERLGNSHLLFDGEEVGYIIRDRPETGLNNDYTADRKIWSRLYRIPEINAENYEYQTRRVKMNRFFFSFTNGKFHNVECFAWKKICEGEFDTLEQLLVTANQSPALRYKLSDHQISDTLHLWDVNG